MKRSKGRTDSESHSKRSKQNEGTDSADQLGAVSVAGDGKSSSHFLENTKIFILEAGIGKARCDIFKKQLRRNGSEYINTLTDEATHIIVDEKMELDRMCRLLKIETPPENAVVVKSLWLSKCIAEKQMLNTTDYELYTSKYECPQKVNVSSTRQTISMQTGRGKPVSSDITTSVSPSTSTAAIDTKKAQEENIQHAKGGVMFRSYKKVNVEDRADSDADSDYVASADEAEGVLDGVDVEELEDLKTTSGPARPLPKGNWACAQASSQQQVNHNKPITDKLEALAKIYQNTNDRWRALGYQKAISALKRQPKAIASFEEARALPGVGEKLANKVWEIIESGELRKLDEISSTEEIKTINLFTNIWGAGATTARHWWAQGFRTLEDLKTKANLTRHQKIGLQYYDELLERMTRAEAGQIEEMVKTSVLSLKPGLVCMACGSYRRGKLTCGDVDVLVTHPDGKSHIGLFPKILRKLHEIAFLTDDLVCQEDNGNQQKYLGVCKLPGENTKHRRLDIIVVPYDEFACAAMYFTGSAHFNRSMRHLAGKMGMSLSEHSLNVGVVRMRGEKLNKGTPLPTPTEESVFKHLGLEYRTPEERDH